MPSIDPTLNLEQQKRAFIESTPRAPKHVCQHLGSIQEFSPGQRLLDDAEMDLALWAHARSYRTSAEESETGVPSGLQQCARLVAPLMPAPLEWGAVSHFQDNVTAALDSPVIHAWLFSDEAAPGGKKKPIRLALIVGRGIPSVRERIVSASLGCLLAVNPDQNNFLLEGLIQIHAAQSEPDDPVSGGAWRDLTVILGRVFGGHHNEVVISENAAEAMEKLESTLKLLATRTGFVRVHDVPFRDLIAFNRQIERHVRDSRQRDSASLWSGHNSQLDLAACRAVGRTDRTGLFELHLNSELLDSPLYKSLQEGCRAAFVEPILADMERRRQFYEDELEQHRSKYDWFQKLSDQEKNALPDVIADREIVWEMCQEIVSEPKPINAREFYTKGMLFKIEKDKQWLQYVDRIHRRMKQLLEHPDAPINCMIAARLFDAAIRDVTPSDNSDIGGLFNCWKKLVQPMLWLEWRLALKRSQIAESDLCTRHTIFNLKMEKAGSKLTLTPLTLVDSVRSVLMFDAARKILVVRDATDYAEAYSAEPDPQLAERLYAEAQTLVEQGASRPDVRSRLLDAIRAAPAHTLGKIVTEWLEHFPVKQEEFERIRETALDRDRPISSAHNALRWCNELCLFSASEAVDKALEGGHRSAVHAAALVMLAYIKCLQAGYSWETLAKLLKDRAAPELQEVAANLFEADRLCQDVVRTFIQQGVLAPIAFLPADSRKMTPGEEGAIAAERAVEAANLAAEFDNALASLDPTKESQRSAYAKLMPAVERCFAADFVPPPSGLDRLIELLTGRKRTLTGL